MAEINEKAICEECGAVNSPDNPVDYIEDPYDAEINDFHIERWLCLDCYNDKQGNI